MTSHRRSRALGSALVATLAAALLMDPGVAEAAKKKHPATVAARARATSPRGGPRGGKKTTPTTPTTPAPPAHETTARSAVLPTPKVDVGDRARSTDAEGLTAAPSSEAATAGGEPAATPAGTRTAKTKVYTFGAMDVEGKLKTPQLLYFLNRVRLELDMSAPDQRSFMKELSRTADDPNL
jgi:hypothetical protein